MEGMQGYYGPPYPAMDPRQSIDGYVHHDSMNNVDPGAMDTTGLGLGQAQTLHQIINQNNEELMRRRNTFQPHYRPSPQDHSRRASMLEFTSLLDGNLANFQFDPNPNDPDMTMTDSLSNMISVQKPHDPRRVRSRDDLSLNTRFSQMNTDLDHMTGINSFSPIVMSSTSVGVEPSAAYMDISMDLDPIPGPTDSVNMQPGPVEAPMFTHSPIDQDFSLPFEPSVRDPGTGPMAPNVHHRMATMQQSISPMSHSFQSPSQQMRRPTPLSTPLSTVPRPGSTMASPIPSQNGLSRRLSADHQNPFSGDGTVIPNREIDTC